jgi:2,3-bisphosphoglycerate-independent phosphoglycerate mutase
MGIANMKYALIIPDGAADQPIEAMSGKTVLEAADLPNIDRLVQSGRIGLAKTVPDGLTPGSDVAIMSVLGYDPVANYTGRAPIEAAAMDIQTRSDQIVFRCNLVTVANGVMEDFSAGHIGSSEAKQLIEHLNQTIGDGEIRFYPGVSYRHVMVAASAEAFAGLATTPPHDIMGRRIDDYLPSGPGQDLPRSLMTQSADILTDHPVNQARRKQGKLPATHIWLWGQGQQPKLATFAKTYGPSGAVITAVDLVRGLGKLIGFRIINVPGATGYLDTDYDGKARAACHALDEVDFVAIHIEAPDEAGHNGDPRAKKLAVERIDRQIVAPVVEKLKQFNSWRILVMPDHPTPVAVRSHTADPVPFVIAGFQVASNGGDRFTERQACEIGLRIDPGWHLMKYFLGT